jgi:hypothetical protein
MPLIFLALGLIAMMAGAASWVVFGLLMWGGLWLLFGTRRRARRAARDARRARRAARWAGVVDQEPIAPPQPIPPSAPAALTPPPQPAVAMNHLPPDVEKQVDRIRRKAAVLGQHPDRFPIGSKDLYVVQHTASDYLPATVNAYLEVPSWSVNTPTGDGRTPLQMLNTQLDLLESKLDEIEEHVRKQRVDNMLANERFLEQNFGKPETEELTLPRVSAGAGRRGPAGYTSPAWRKTGRCSANTTWAWPRARSGSTCSCPATRSGPR